MAYKILSIIMGVYNIEALPVFDRMAESILMQTEKNFEWIICDDGSLDGTRQILKQLADRDARIKIIYFQKNRGLASALNACLQLATGEFIARQDADDYSDYTRLEKQIAFLIENPDIDFVGSNALLFDENGVWKKRCFPFFPIEKDFLFTQPFLHGSLLFRRKALLSVGGYLATRLTRRAEDYELLMRMYALGMKGANIQEYLYYFQEDEKAAMRRKYRFRIDETCIRFQGFLAMGLLPQGLPYVVKPLLVGLCHPKLLRKLKQLSNRSY